MYRWHLRYTRQKEQALRTRSGGCRDAECLLSPDPTPSWFGAVFSLSPGPKKPRSIAVSRFRFALLYPTYTPLGRLYVLVLLLMFLVAVDRFFALFRFCVFFLRVFVIFFVLRLKFIFSLLCVFLL